METLNTPFKHSKWFITLNKETQKYEPYTTKKEALQYFVSSGDFYNDNGVLRYSGKEKGSYKMSQKESDYFTQLLKQKVEAKEEAKKHIEILKILVSEENKRIQKNFIFKNCIVSITVYFGSEYVHTGVSFIDYIEENGGDTKKILYELQSIDPVQKIELTLF